MKKKKKNLFNWENWFVKENLMFVQKDGVPYYDFRSGEWKEQKGFRYSSPTVREKGCGHTDFKRVAYPSNYEWYDHFVIDADCGQSKINPLPALVHLSGVVYIRGTDNPNKPKDSASIVIFFEPIPKTGENRELLTKTIRVFNLGSGGDIRNVGYQHKNPWLPYVTVSSSLMEPRKGRQSRLEDIFMHGCSVYGIEPNEVNELWKGAVRRSFDRDLEALVSTENPAFTKVKAYWFASSRLPEMRGKVEPFLNLKTMDEWVVVCRLYRFYFKEIPEAVIGDAMKQYSMERGDFVNEIVKRKVGKFNKFRITREMLERLGFAGDKIDRMIEMRDDFSRKPRKHDREIKRADMGKKHVWKSTKANEGKTGMRYEMKARERKQRSDCGKAHRVVSEHSYRYGDKVYLKSKLIKFLKLGNVKNYSRKFKELGIVRIKN